MKIVIATGGFDPIHSGHIRYLNAARELGDWLLVGVNSDAWLERKKGRAFMPFAEREAILYNIKSVDAVRGFDDSNGSACDLLEWVKQNFPYAEIVFANGGDRTQDNIPEMQVKGVEFVFGVGGEDKANSSSWILEEWKAPKIQRPWGYYRVLHDVEGTKVKELTVDPGKSLSMQRHKYRAEIWKVTSGMCRVFGNSVPTTLGRHGSYYISRNEWHQLTNPFTEPCKIVEIQYGYSCDEEDIERR